CSSSSAQPNPPPAHPLPSAISLSPPDPGDNPNQRSPLSLHAAAMAAPDTTTTAPLPPPSESTTTTYPMPQQAPPPRSPPPAAESNPTPKKRKLEQVGFHHSPYYKIRATVANLRGRFLQVCQATGSQKKDTAIEILKDIKVVIELSKKTRLDLYSVVDPVKPSVIPAATTSKDEPAGRSPYADKNQVPPINLAGNSVQNTGGNVPLKPDNSETAGQKLVSPGEINKEARTSDITDYGKQPGRVLRGSYVIGGSPIGCNFLMWPGSKVVYYGLTKAEWLARQSAKMKFHIAVQQSDF
ncbi:hypothetical protein EJB05_38425, partial [Eragrostis curvula]